ncbi:hypothetical protein V6N12_069064 [Hibiscus sabdariffa]|uniref:Uncharacterized protein n=1 Tax=Hibiscus sabdariffa TaxID=183260 RepID=A0ABR2FCV3_9ROSI
MKRRDNNAAIPPLQKKKHNDPSLHQGVIELDDISALKVQISSLQNKIKNMEGTNKVAPIQLAQQTNLSMGERGDHVLCLTGETVGRPCGSIRSVDMCQLSLACSDGLARCRRRGNRPAEGTMGQAGQLWRIGSMVRLDHPIGFKSWSYTGLM